MCNSEGTTYIEKFVKRVKGQRISFVLPRDLLPGSSASSIGFFVAKRALKQQPENRKAKARVDFFEIHERLNQNPLPLERVELRKALYQCYSEQVLPIKAIDFEVISWDDNTNTGTLRILVEDALFPKRLWVEVRCTEEMMWEALNAEDV